MRSSSPRWTQRPSRSPSTCARAAWPYPTRYRLNDDLEHWKLKDPIARVRAHLIRGGGADEEFFATVDAEAEQVAEHLREGCLAMPDPDVLDIFGLVYGEQTEELATQREQFASYLASFEPSREGAPA